MNFFLFISINILILFKTEYTYISFWRHWLLSPGWSAERVGSFFLSTSEEWENGKKNHWKNWNRIGICSLLLHATRIDRYTHYIGIGFIKFADANIVLNEHWTLELIMIIILCCDRYKMNKWCLYNRPCPNPNAFAFCIHILVFFFIIYFWYRASLLLSLLKSKWQWKVIYRFKYRYEFIVYGNLVARSRRTEKKKSKIPLPTGWFRKNQIQIITPKIITKENERQTKTL